MPKPRQPK
jgi:hypothetical protein